MISTIYTLTYDTDGHGTIDGEAIQSVAYSEDGTTVTAIPDEGYHFVNWSDGVDTTERTDSNITNNHTITAFFAKEPAYTTFVAYHEGVFNYPIALSKDGNGNLYVADSGDNSVKVFDQEGDSTDTIPFDLSYNIDGMKVEANGNMYIIADIYSDESDTYQLDKYDSEENLTGSAALSGYPAYITADNDGNVYFMLEDYNTGDLSIKNIIRI